jgi:hypothetical protein
MPVANNSNDAFRTSVHVKNWVKVSNGATLSSTTHLKPAKNPVATNQPDIAAKIPSSKNGS